MIKLVNHLFFYCFRAQTQQGITEIGICMRFTELLHMRAHPQQLLFKAVLEGGDSAGPKLCHGFSPGISILHIQSKQKHHEDKKFLVSILEREENKQGSKMLLQCKIQQRPLKCSGKLERKESTMPINNNNKR